MVRLSVITVVRDLVFANRVAKFRQCVESVHGQTCIDEIEHLVVDGGSTDGTEALLEEYADRGWIQVLTRPDHSIYEAMNNGLERARGIYVLYLNSDDFLFNDTGLGMALRELESAGADYSFGDTNILDGEGNLAGIWQGSISGLPFARNYCHQSMIIRTELLRQYGGFDLQYRVSSDSDLMLRLFKEDRRYVQSCHSFACYRLGGVSSQCRLIAQADHASAFYRHFGREAGLSLDDCMCMWDFSILKRGDLARARELVGKLPFSEWRSRFEEKIREVEFLEVEVQSGRYVREAAAEIGRPKRLKRWWRCFWR